MNIFQEIPLPFDDDLKEMEEQEMNSVNEDAEELHKKMTEWYKQNPDWGMKKVG